MVDDPSTTRTLPDPPYLLDPPERDPQNPNDSPGGPLPAHLPYPLPDPHSYERNALEAVEQPFFLSVAFRHSGWVHNRGLIARSLQRTHQSFSRQSHFCYCGSNSYVLQSVDQPDVYRIAGSSCHDRFCLPCANERSQAIALNVLDLTAGKQIRFLTLTLKASSDPLSTQLDKLYASFQNLRRRQLWKAKVTGGVAFLELTYSTENQTWHPHFHILVEGHYIPQQQLKKLWYQITGDSFVVDIRFVHDLRTASRYVTKYASKPFNNTFLNRKDPLDEAILALKGRKLLLTFGTWRGITLIETPSDGAWEHVAPLEDIIVKAAHGDPDSLNILRKLTDTDLQPIFARAPPLTPPKHTPGPVFDQLTFFAAWQADGQYTYPPFAP